MLRGLRKTRYLLCAAVAVSIAGTGARALGAVTVAPDGLLRIAIAMGCTAAHLTPAEMAKRLPDAAGATQEPLTRNDRDRTTVIGWRRHFPLKQGGEIRLNRIAPSGLLSSLVAEYDAPERGKTRPRLIAISDAFCRIESARRLDYDAEGHAVAIELLDGTFSPTGRRLTLLAPLPSGRDPGGVTVAIADTGVNYLLPTIAKHLARDRAGMPLGYDFWEMDPRPFDRHAAASPFFPDRHGTLTAGVLIAEAPKIRLIPYRYPRPEMSRFGALVDDAAAKGARILSVSLGSDNRAEWQSFADAVMRHRDLLVVVSAGNDGRDLDIVPVYPAALQLDNMITVTSADPKTGMPAKGENWGGDSVDLAVPAQRISVAGFDGAATVVSGSSFAAPRVAALAARLLLEHPDWHAFDLKSAIFARAKPVLQNGERLLRHGFIADPATPGE